MLPYSIERKALWSDAIYKRTHPNTHIHTKTHTYSHTCTHTHTKGKSVSKTRGRGVAAWVSQDQVVLNRVAW